MTNVVHKFLIYPSIHFCLTCFGLSFSPSSEAGVQFRQWFKCTCVWCQRPATQPIRRNIPEAKNLSTEINCAKIQEAARKYVSGPASFSMQQPCDEDWLGNTSADIHHKSSRLPQAIHVIVTHRQISGKMTTTVNNYVGPSRSGMYCTNHLTRHNLRS
jgi:hypothetical protein